MGPECARSLDRLEPELLPAGPWNPLWRQVPVIEKEAPRPMLTENTCSEDNSHLVAITGTPVLQSSEDSI